MKTYNRTYQKDEKKAEKFNNQENDNGLSSYSKVQKNWKNIKCKGKRPTLDELKSYIYLDPKIK